MKGGVRVVGAPAPEDETEGVDAEEDAEARDAAGGRGAGGDDVRAAGEDAVGGSGDAAGSVGATATATASPGRGRGRQAAGRAVARAPRRLRLALVLAVVVALLGLAGTAGFGLAWAGQQSQQDGEAQAERAARSFLVALTNFDAKTVDRDFAAITAMATGTFAGQAARFFNSSIRQELETALASSRGQIRDLSMQSYTGGHASVYAVIDQLYVNDKISSPQSDVLRVVVDLAQRPSGWRVADVTVLTGPTLGSATTGASGAAAPSGATAAGGATAADGSTTTTAAPAG